MAFIGSYPLGVWPRRDGEVTIDQRGKEFDVTIDSLSGILELKTYVFSSEKTAHAFAKGFSLAYNAVDEAYRKKRRR